MFRVSRQVEIRNVDTGEVIDRSLKTDRSLEESSAETVVTVKDGDTNPSSSDPHADPHAGRTRSDAVSQSMILLATMTVLLLAARFAVPGIVEEIRYGWHRGELRAAYEIGTDGLKNVSLDTLSNAYQMVTAVVGPSVVHIDVQRSGLGISNDLLAIGKSDPVAPGGMLFPAADQGSGIVVDDEGYILTNRHVIADGSDIMVTLSDGRRRPATVVGTDTLTDLAVLKISADKLIPIAWSDSDQCRVGTPVWAVGSPFGLDRTVTFGILSGKHRMVRASTQYQDFMQSDVAVNPGNSGGPLVDAHGKLVGINTAIVGDTYQGVSFSIPSNVARGIYDRLRKRGIVERAWLGVALTEVSDEKLVGENARVRGAMVSGLAGTESPASMAGIISGDVILSLDGKAVRDVSHLMQLIGESVAGKAVTFGIHRAGQSMDLVVRLDSRPASMDR